MAQNSFNAKERRPGNNVIFPGNQVTHLNAYRDQGVQAVPGVNFFRQVGAIVITPEDNCTALLDENGELPAGDYDVKILSPDLRPDDKPRLDRSMVVPEGASVYRTSIQALNLEGVAADGSTTLTVKGVTPAAVLTESDGSDEDGEGVLIPAGDFNTSESVTPFEGFGDLTPLATDKTVQVTTNKSLKPKPYCGGGSGYANADSSRGQTAILVEVCFFMDAPAVDADDTHLPFPIEAGQSRN